MVFKVGDIAIMTKHTGILCIGDKVHIKHVYKPGIYDVYRIIDGASQLSIREQYMKHASREAQLKSLRLQKEEVKREIAELKKELEILTKYKDEEDYLAHKIHEILKHKDDPEAIRKILKEGSTHLL